VRTAQRDQRGTTTFGGYIVDAPSGAGAVGGVQFTFTRTGTGSYRLDFDVRLTPTAVTATADNADRVVMIGGIAPGTFTVLRHIGNTSAAENGGFFFSCTCLDKRT
jgi:hypothetical protein